MVFYFCFQTVQLVLSFYGISVLDDLSVILYYVILPAWYISWFTFISRLWLLYFTIQHSIATINNQWQEVISSKHKTRNFYLTQKSTWGTWNGLKKKMLIYAIVTYINDVISGILLIVYRDNETVFWVLLLTLGLVKAFTSTVIPMGFLCYMVMTIRKLHFHDNMGLGRELRFCT